MDPQPAQNGRQEIASRLLIVTMLFLFMNGPGNQVPAGNGFSARDHAEERIVRSRHSLDILNATRWQDFTPVGLTTPGYEPGRYLNLTGFRKGDAYRWELLDPFKDRCDEFSQKARLSWMKEDESLPTGGFVGQVYDNVTGIAVGEWTRYRGAWERSERKRPMNLTEISPDIDWAFEKPWTRNITGLEGKMVLRIDEKHVEELNLDEHMDINWNGAQAREVAATMTLQDETSSGDGWEMRVHGVHWPRTGVLLMTTTSDKFAGIFGLPHLALTPEYFDSGKQLLNRTLEKTIEKMEKSNWIDPSNPWTSSPDSQGDAMMPAPHCEFVVHAQVHPISFGEPRGNNLQNMVAEIEQELRYPNGAPVPITPPLKLSTVIMSPDCGFLLESKGPPGFSPREGNHLIGKKQELWLHDIEHWLLIFAVICFSQVLLLKMQSKESSTPSTIGRVSLYTVTTMLMGDAFLFTSLSFLCTMAPNLFPSSLMAAFSAVMSMFLGVRFVGAVYNVQEPERRERLRARQAAEAANAPPPPRVVAAGAALARAGNPTDQISASATVPPTAPAVVRSTPIIVPSDQDIDAEIAVNRTPTPRSTAPLLPTVNAAVAIQAQPRDPTSFGTAYVRFVVGLILILFISASATSWSPPWRSAYVHLLSILYLSFWLPQIHRNVVRNCRKALLWKFIIGQSILRLLPFAYFYLKEDNMLFAETDWKAFAVYAGWVWVQIWILVAQEILGPRWGVPKGWTEEGWDYHPILREDNVEAGGLPIGLVQIPGSPTLSRSDTGDSQDRKKNDGSFRSVDCSICMQVLEVPIVAAGEDSTSANGVTGMMARRLYMVTPCRHVFHSHCLEGWMRFRLQCPICRENLPPL